MPRIVVTEFLTLDGVMQAPGSPTEDRDGGFDYGGWQMSYFDDVFGEFVMNGMAESGGMLLGRRTYDIFAGYWPKQDPSVQPTVPFNKATKYVLSKSSPDLSWQNSVLIDGDVVAKLKELKAGEGPMLQVHGSGNMIQTLLKNDLVDELWLKIFPVLLGNGKRLFADGTVPAGFELISSETTPLGVIYASYKRAGEVRTGSFA